MKEASENLKELEAEIKGLKNEVGRKRLELKTKSVEKVSEFKPIKA